MKSRFIKLFFLGLIWVAVLSAAIMLLWNLLIPGILGLATINFWQALGLFILTRILFGRFGFGRGGMMMHAMHHGRNGLGENPIHQKWQNMTPDERREFIERRRRFGFGGPFGRDYFDNGVHEEQGKEDE